MFVMVFKSFLCAFVSVSDTLLQVFHLNVSKIDRDVTRVAM
jgi:hypothetical protein